MKKLLLFLLFLCLPLALSAIWFGDGSSPANAYYGVINSATPMQPWNLANYPSGVIYVGRSSTGQYDLEVGTGGILTIGAGITVKFCTINSDLRTTGTGVLNASGSSSSNITFTKNTQATWGHLSITGSGACQLSFCTIEWGKKLGVNEEGYGGGLHINNTNVTISNCSLRNNYALWGGGIMVDASVSPIINNCLIYSNTSSYGGGGVEIDPGSSPSFNNCIIRNNTNSVSTLGGGGLMLYQSGSAKFSNCAIVNNASAGNNGVNVYFYGSNGASLINTIAWSHENCVYFQGAYLSSNLINSAIQRIYNSAGTIALTAFTYCYDLGITNTAADGPNFVDPTNSNYAITFISPARDAGTSAGAPLTDFLGNSRIGPYDIGAYEVQYSTWSGAISTDWATVTNWQASIVPISGTSDVIIPTGLTNYPTGSTSQNFTIGTGRQLLLNPGAKVTLGTLTNDGTLKLESDGSNISSLIVTTFSGNAATIELFLTGGNPGAPLKLNKWHFISTPVSALPVISTFTSITQNIVGWYDNQVSGTLATGWVAFDGYRYSTGGLGGPTFSNLTPGNGYDYYATTDQKYTFSGQLNTSDVAMSLSFIVNDALHGFNLLGNPFSSGLNWEAIINNTSPAYPANTSKSLYFTRDNAQCSYVSGVGIPSDVTGIIPPMQGFFVKTYGAGNTITIPAGARVQGGIHARYKGDMVIPLVRLSLAEGTLTDETVVRFDAAAKSGLDYDFDAPKMFLSPDILSIYSTSGGSNLAINGLPFPDPSVEIPIVVNLTATGTHTISTTQLQGLDNYNVTLTDNTTGFISDLKATPVLTFSASMGTITDRFILKVGTITTGVENPVVSKNTFNIYPANNMINIQTISDQWDGKSGSVKVLDLTGKTVSDLNNSEFSKNSLIQVASPVAKGIYMVEIKSGFMRYVGKVVIK